MTSNMFQNTQTKIDLMDWRVKFLEVAHTSMNLFMKTGDKIFFEHTKYFAQLAKDYKNQLEKL